MTTWIMLIVVISGGILSSKILFIDKIEFTSHETCVKARQSVLQAFEGTNVQAICMEK